jgi:hypothetical protein
LQQLPVAPLCSATRTTQARLSLPGHSADVRHCLKCSSRTKRFPSVLLLFQLCFWRKASLSTQPPNQEFIMGKGNNSHKKEAKKPKKEKPKILATRKTT